MRCLLGKDNALSSIDSFAFSHTILSLEEEKCYSQCLTHEQASSFKGMNCMCH